MNNSEKYLPQKLDYLLDLTLFYQHDCKSPYFLQKTKVHNIIMILQQMFKILKYINILNSTIPKNIKEYINTLQNNVEANRYLVHMKRCIRYKQVHSRPSQSALHIYT